MYANVWNAVDAFGGGDPTTVGNTLTALFPAGLNQTNLNFTINQTTVSWNPHQVYDPKFLGNFTNRQLWVLAFEVFIKIFESYNLHLPDEFEHKFEQLAANTSVPVNNGTINELVLFLLERFLVSAVYYLVACVHLVSDCADS